MDSKDGHNGGEKGTYGQVAYRDGRLRHQQAEVAGVAPHLECWVMMS